MANVSMLQASTLNACARHGTVLHAKPQAFGDASYDTSRMQHNHSCCHCCAFACVLPVPGRYLPHSHLYHLFTPAAQQRALAATTGLRLALTSWCCLSISVDTAPSLIAHLVWHGFQQCYRFAIGR